MTAARNPSELENNQDRYLRDLSTFVIPALRNAPDFNEPLLVAKHNAFHRLASVLPALRDQGVDSGALALGHAIGPAALDFFEMAAERAPMPVLSGLLNDLASLMFYSTNKRDDKRIDDAIFSISKRAPTLAVIPNHGHCAWFSGRTDAGNPVVSLPQDYLVNMAKYLSLHRDGELTLWTDAPALMARCIRQTGELLKYASDTPAERDASVALLQQLHRSSLEAQDFLSSASKIKIKHWDSLFSKDWGSFSRTKKADLRSAINNEIHGSAPYRYPASGKDIFLASALALEGGLGFDLDIKFKSPIKIFDPVGMQCLERPGIKAATRGSKAALLTIDKMATVLHDTKRFTEKRNPVSRDGNAFNSLRHQLSNEIVFKFDEVLNALYGKGSMYRFAALSSLVACEDTGAFVVPDGEFKGLTMKGARLQHATAPARLEQG